MVCSHSTKLDSQLVSSKFNKYEKKKTVARCRNNSDRINNIDSNDKTGDIDWWFESYEQFGVLVGICSDVEKWNVNRIEMIKLLKIVSNKLGTFSI